VKIHPVPEFQPKSSKSASRRVTPDVIDLPTPDVSNAGQSADKRDLDWHKNPLSKSVPSSRSNSASKTNNEWNVY